MARRALSRFTGWPMLALAALAWFAVSLAGLGQAPLLDVDEGAFAEASREMLASGDWGHTTLNGADRFDKPILVYWLQAASLALLGVNEFAVRLPSALCALGSALALALYAAPRWGRATAATAAVVLATSLGPLLMGRAATADALLNLLLLLTLCDLARCLENPLPGQASAAAPRRRAALWMGLGLLCKGPVAVVLPAGALLLWWLGRGTGLARAQWPRLRSLLADRVAWALLLAVATPWYAYALQRHGWAFVQGFLLRHNVDRFNGPLEGHGGSLLYYLAVVPLLLLPWSPLLLPVLARARGWWRADRERWLLAWAGFVLLLFSLSGTKLPHYALYGFAPLALLAAVVLTSQMSGEKATLAEQAPRAAVWLAVVALLALGAASPWLTGVLVQRSGDPHWTQRLSAPSLPAAPPMAELLLTCTALLLAAAWAARGAVAATRPTPATAQAPLQGLLAAALALALWLCTQVLPWWALALQDPVRQLALQARGQAWPLVQWQVHQPSSGFYSQQATPRRAPDPASAEVALVRSDRVPAGFNTLAHAPGFALVRAAAPAASAASKPAGRLPAATPAP